MLEVIDLIVVLRGFAHCTLLFRRRVATQRCARLVASTQATEQELLEALCFGRGHMAVLAELTQTLGTLS